MEHERSERFQVFAQLLWVATATVLGRVIQKGGFDSIPLLGLALALAGLALTLPGRTARGVAEHNIVVLALVAAVAFQFSELFTTSPALYLKDSSPTALQPFQQGVVVAALLSGASAGQLSRGARIACIAALLLVHFSLGVWIIRASPNPHIDVYVLTQNAIRGFLEGGNAYSSGTPNIYANEAMYAPGLVVDGKLKFGYPYPPLGILLGVPGYVLFGDPRYSQLLALTATGACLASARLNRVTSLAIALFLFTPRSFFVLEQSWIEPFVVLMLALVMRVADARPSLLPWVFGAFMTVKQYVALFFPLGWLLFPKRLFRRDEFSALVAFGARAAVCVALIVAWFVWSGPKSFLRSVALVHIAQPFRADSLSYPALWVHDGGPIPSSLLGLGVAMAVMLYALWRAPRTAAGFAGALAICSLAFFAYGKQAFSNYYYFVIGAVCCTLAFSVSSKQDAAASTVAS